MLDDAKNNNLEKFQQHIPNSFDAGEAPEFNKLILPPILQDNPKWIHILIYYGAIDIVREYIASVPIDITDENNRQPIHFAAASQNLDMLQFIESFGGSFDSKDADGHPVIYYAIQSVDIINYIYMTGYSFTANDLVNAAEKQSNEVFKIIFNFLIEESPYRTDIVQAYYRINGTKAHELFEFLVSKGVDLSTVYDEMDPHKYTLLHTYVVTQNMVMLKEILPFIKDFYVRDAAGWTAYELACQRTMKNFIRELEKYGA